jgi:hypothetical protein
MSTDDLLWTELYGHTWHAVVHCMRIMRSNWPSLIQSIDAISASVSPLSVSTVRKCSIAEMGMTWNSLIRIPLLFRFPPKPFPWNDKEIWCTQIVLFKFLLLAKILLLQLVENGILDCDFLELMTGICRRIAHLGLRSATPLSQSPGGSISLGIGVLEARPARS